MLAQGKTPGFAAIVFFKLTVGRHIKNIKNRACAVFLEMMVPVQPVFRQDARFRIHANFFTLGRGNIQGIQGNITVKTLIKGIIGSG